MAQEDDERIRKALITFFNRFPYDSIEAAGTNAKEAIAWLEKQKAIDVLDEEEREFADNVDSYRKEVDAAYQKGYNEGVKATLEKQDESLNESVYDTEDKEIYQAISIGLTDVFNEFGWSDFGGIPIKNIQNWLEKQDEQKP